MNNLSNSIQMLLLRDLSRLIVGNLRTDTIPRLRLMLNITGVDTRHFNFNINFITKQTQTTDNSKYRTYRKRRANGGNFNDSFSPR